jgi:phosphonate transport system substrate-binding protein
MQRRWSTFLIALVALLVICWDKLPAAAGSPSASDASNKPFRMAFSSAMFTEVNENDAKASMKLWMNTVAQARQVPLDPDPTIYSDVAAIDRSLRINLPDGMGLTTEEYWLLSKAFNFDRVVVAVNNGHIGEEYVVLAHRDRGISDIEGLRGRSLLVLTSPRMSLAMLWFDTLLLQKGFAPAAEHVSRVTCFSKPSRVVLPVFFLQADACIITRRHFETMSELNPQIGQKLRVLASSPGLVPSMFAFLAENPSPHRDRVLMEMRRLSDSPAGQQLLTLLQADSIEERPVSIVDKSLELVSTYNRLCAARKDPPKAGARSAATEYRGVK